MKALSTTVLLFGLLTASLHAQLSLEKARQQIRDFQEAQSHVKSLRSVALSPDGSHLAWTVSDSQTKRQSIYTAALASPAAAHLLQPSSGAPCSSSDPAWSPDGRRLAFFSDCDTSGQIQVFVADAAAKASPRQLSHLKGYISHLGWSPDGTRISLLYVASASRTPSPLAAENKLVGVIDDLADRNVQQLTTIDAGDGRTVTVTPANLYIFEYDWSPDGQKVTYTAAPPPGDDNWYIAKLYTQPLGAATPTVIYQPKFQIASPRWSPKGRQIAFIEGLMSDEGATGGEIYLLPAQGGDGEPRNLTPGRSSSPAWFTWLSEQQMLFSEYVGGATALNTLDTASGAAKELWEAGDTLQASEEAASLSVAASKPEPTIAMMRTSWARLPEVWAGTTANLKQITHINGDVSLHLPQSKSLTWKSGAFSVQGWLLFPHDYDPKKKYPMLVCVHGGPAWIAQPTWQSPDFNATIFTNLGYFVLYPNDRGSLGQGEKFTQANRREWGFGDLDDLVAGVDAAVQQFPIDSDRVGILGWSYGGSTSMMAVTRTHRFRAAVAGAGAVDMLSYYGQNSIDKWMIPYFGASVYDDPQAYLRCSAISYIKNASTPTLILVGELDGEAPPAQSLEFWHALKDLGVPTQLVIYPDEGHDFFKPEDRVDLTFRTFAWFQKYMSSH